MVEMKLAAPGKETALTGAAEVVGVAAEEAAVGAAGARIWL